MNSRQRRYLANLNQRYGEDLRQLRVQMRALLTPQCLDELGREMAEFVAGYRAEHHQGPTRRELCVALDLVERLAPIPEQMPAAVHRIWRSAVVDPLLVGARRRGWITYTAQPRSLTLGKRARFARRAASAPNDPPLSATPS